MYERQIPSVKMLFKTNTKGHKHPNIRLFIIEQDTIGKPKKTKSGIQPRNSAPPKTKQKTKQNKQTKQTNKQKLTKQNKTVL